MNDYTFRIRFRLSPVDRIGVESPALDLHFADLPQHVSLCTPDRQTLISKSQDVIARASGFADAVSASSAAEQFQRALSVSFARLSMGADFGALAPRSFFTEFGLQAFESEAKSRLLNDVHGAQVFETEPPPRFLGVGPVSLIRSMQPARLLRVLAAAGELEDSVPQTEGVAFELYHSSFFEIGARSRFLSLMMAIEALLESELRGENVRYHLDFLVDATSLSSELLQSEKESLIGGLRSLYNQSMMHRATKLLEARLGTRRYDGRSPIQFYRECYSVRNKIVHSGRSDVDGRVGHLAANLEVLVSHLLGHQLLAVDV